MFLVAANTRQALVGQKEWITTGSSGIQVQFLFSADWDGLAKFAVFRNAEIEESVIPIALPASGLTELPAENCAAEYVDEKVYVGVYGTDGLGHIIIPTIWVSLGVLKEGAAYEGMDPPKPTQDMWAQILAIAQNAGAENAAAAEQSAEEAEASKEAIQDMNVQAETLPDESPLTVTKEVDPETGAVTLVFGLTRGPKGTKGDDGYSPTITITPIQGGHRFTVTDEDHPTGQSFDVMNGAPGAPGSPGQDGYSPAITITTITGGHRFTVTDEDHPTGQSFDVMDGTKGDQGYSPAVTITTITGGHRVTITDEDHPTGQSFDVLDGASDAGQVTFDPTQTYQSGTVGKELSDQSNAISQKAPIIINTASGDIASFADGEDGMPIKKIVGTIVPVQSGTGDPSPDNVRPISGWTGANITVAGINIWDEEWENGYWNTTTGEPVTANNYIRCKNFIRVKPNTAYRMSVGKTDTQQNQAIWFDENYSIISTPVFGPNVILTSPANAKYLKFYMNWHYGNVYLNDISINNPSTYTGYYSHSTTLPINWQDTEAGTIYGGTVTLNEDGSVTLIRTHKGIHLGGLTWTKDSAGGNTHLFYSNWDNLRIISSGMKCSILLPESSQSTLSYWRGSNAENKIGRAGVSGDPDRLYIKPVGYTTVTEVNTLMNGQYFIAQMTTPEEYVFSDVGDLYTYLGTNNVWIDTGAITECDYPADTKLYVDGLTAPDEDMIADGLIASGKYFTVNNQLYLSTAQIAAGAQIIPGSNCTATSITEALNALNA